MEEKWTVRYDAAEQRMVVTVQGYASDDNSRHAAQRFTALLGKRTVDMIVEVRQVTGYTTGARRAWQEALYPVRSQILRIIIVGGEVPAMVRMAATVVAAFIGVPIRFFGTLADFEGSER